jgi:uncharacterized protein YebE (UPF0316 family)
MVGTERKEATDMNPSRIIIYVVARDVILLSLWSVEYIVADAMGYTALDSSTDTYCMH